MAGHLSIIASKLRRAAPSLPYLPRTLALVWRAAPSWTAASAVLLVLQGILPGAVVYLTRPLVDAIATALRAQSDWRPVLAPAALMAAVLLLAESLRAASHWIRASQSELIQDHIYALIHEKSIAMDFAFYESPDFYNHLHRARAEAGHRPLALLDSLGGLIQNSITLLAIGALLIPFGPWLPVLLMLSTLPAFFVVLRAAVRQHQWRVTSTQDERRAWYYEWLLTSSESAAELRLFGLGPHFQQSFRVLRRRLSDQRVKLARSQGLGELAAGSAAIVISAASIAWMGWKALRGLASLGDLAMFYQAFQQGLRLMRTLLDNIGQIYQHTLFLGNLFEFLALEPVVVSPPNPVPVPAPITQSIHFRDVTFHYPGSARAALDRFDLAIPAGQIAAIIGPNGAGKSTLLKLLCRFYDPRQGSIEIDGSDLRSLNLDDLRARITVLFQQPVQYNATVRENIALGDLVNPSVEAAAEAAGAAAFIRGLPSGYDTALGKWFVEGSGLSVGEWQRIALARAFLRQAPMIVLDEPTSAMDPWAEAEWLDRFRRLAAGRTAILITHRFTTARLADRIHVMDHGRIAESGSHDELIATGGRYAAWWTAQRIG